MPRRSIDDLGELQRGVMEAVWALGEATVQQVREQVAPPSRELAYTTVLSVMQKLEKLGWLRHRSEGRTYVYRAARTREQAGAATVRTFLDRVFGGDPRAMMQHLIAEGSLSDDDLAALNAMIEKKRKERRDA
jgi:BlaI family penicillinase repressor